MSRNRSDSPDTVTEKAAKVQEVDYQPKTYTLHQQFVSGLKLLLIGGVVFLFFWLVEVYGVR